MLSWFLFQSNGFGLEFLWFNLPNLRKSRGPLGGCKALVPQVCLGDKEKVQVVAHYIALFSFLFSFFIFYFFGMNCKSLLRETDYITDIEHASILRTSLRQERQLLTSKEPIVLSYRPFNKNMGSPIGYSRNPTKNVYLHGLQDRLFLKLYF